MPSNPRPRHIKNYGWIPDLPDHRDKLYGVRAPRKLPSSVDLRMFCSSVEDQGQLGSCTANALVGALEFLERKDGASFEDLSRLFIYYNERAIEGTVSQDSGAMIRDGVKSLASLGVCTETKWPYAIARFAVRPTPPCYLEAKKHVVTSYTRLQTVNEMRACLSDGFPFVFGFTVYESFESATVARSGIVPMPTSRESTLGGHAVMAAGYDDKAKRFLCRNSWGPSWGQAGYFWMPYAYLDNRNLSDDFWTLRRAGS